ncbi:MAG TPA: DNA-processing protein DprA [Flavipsychrobacter sp.]|nr:DNA-processing protein DprA [Flavipsychrobacter sp.]
MLPDERELFYLLALTFMPGIGGRTGRTLIEQFGNASNVFKASAKDIKNSIGEGRAKSFADGSKDEVVFQNAEKEVKFIGKHNVQILLFSNADFPQRLNRCSDAPLLLFYKGNANLNADKIVAIVGTRRNTEYGLKLCEELVEGLQSQDDIIIVSGLASGIDSIAHKKSVGLGVPTVGVVGHGLDRTYPSSNKNLANEMVQNGGVLTEFPSGTIPDKENFPKRNRIVAGISDITVVVESDIAGGALITARLASGYNRDVAAFPGRTSDSKSAGCNNLIRTNVAAMITKTEDLLDLMNWNKNHKPKSVQKQLFINLSPEEQKVIDLLQSKESVHADELFHYTGLANSQLAATLLQLEMQGLVKTLPGKQYRMV